MIYDLVIIGGGASGLAAAITASRRQKSVLLLEKEDKLCTKLLMTGNGKCNVDNAFVTPDRYNRPAFVEPILKKTDVSSFLASVGLLTRRIDDRIYPYSESALTVANMLRYALQNVDVRTETVTKIEKKDCFVLNGQYYGNNIALCTGSAATKGTNSHCLYAPFGHTSTALTPSLTALKTDLTFIKGLSGLRAKVSLTLTEGGSCRYTERGELLFRDNGLSGIVAMALSTYIARRGGKYDVSIDFTPDFTEEEIERFLQNGRLEGILPKAVAQAVSVFARKTNVTQAHAVKHFIVKDAALGSNPQVMHGGLKTTDFDCVSLESKLQKGLFACGEVLDVDGECGGFNLHWAFASGITVGESI